MLVKMMPRTVARELTDQERQAIDEVFALFDTHGNQTIAISQLGTLMRALGQIPTQAELQAIIDEVDADGNGVMEYYEFVDLMSRVPWGEQGSQSELTGAVHALFDRQHDGLASVADMRRLLTSVGEPLSDEELDMMLKQLDPDGDRTVTCEEIIREIMKFSVEPVTHNMPTDCQI